MSNIKGGLADVKYAKLTEAVYLCDSQACSGAHASSASVVERSSCGSASLTNC